MKKIIILIISLIVIPNISISQDQITIYELYKLAIRNHPLSLQDSLYNIQTEYNISFVKKNFLPEMHISGQFTYQSEVPVLDIPVPGITLPEFPKDHYNLNLDVNQLIYDGGVTKTLQEIEKTKGISLKELTQKEIYSIYDNINNAYFGILLINEKHAIVESVKDDLNNKLNILELGLENEVSSQNDYDLVYAEFLKLNENIIELKYNKAILISTINELTGARLKNQSTLENPSINKFTTNQYNRPEYKIIEAQQDMNDIQLKLLGQNKLPKVAGFAQAGYGQPGYNMFSEGFSDYYMVGIRFKWNIYDWNITKDKRESIRIQKEIVNNKRISLDRSLQIAINKLNTEIDKIKDQKDLITEIVQLKQNILLRSETALNSGSIIYSEYIKDVNELSRARIQLSTYNILESQAKMNMAFITGEVKIMINN